MGNPDGPPRLHFAPVPPLPLRKKIPAATASRCLSLWAANLQSLRRLSDADFAAVLHDDTDTSLVSFVRSYILNDDLSHDGGNDWVYSTNSTTDTARYVKRGVRSLIHRGATTGATNVLLTPRAFVKLAALYTTDGARSLLRTLYTADETLAKDYVREHVKYLTAVFSGKTKGKGKAVGDASESEVGLLQELSYLLMALPEIADVVMADPAFFEALAERYASSSNTSTEELRRVVFTVVVAAVQARRYNALMDFLFSVTEGGDMSGYIAAVVASTPLLDRLAAVDAAGFANRWATVLQRLRKTTDTNTATTTRKLSRLPRRKTKLSAGGNGGGMAGIAGLREMFPHIDEGTLQAVLASVDGDVEAATMALLDGIPDAPPTTTAVSNTTKVAADELDSLSVPTSRLYLGKRAESTADALLSDRATAPSKDRILAALQSFDSDDDERDDTYDADDIGGAVDRGDTADEASAAAAGAATNISDEDRILYKALVDTPGVFSRDAATRRGAERRKLREATGMTDEAVEGWKVMLDRDGGKRLRQLEIRFSREATAAAEQTVIPRTAWRQGDDGDDDGEGTSRGYGHGRGGGYRGRGRGGAGPNDRNVRGQARDHAPVVRDVGPEGPRVVKKTSKARGEHSRKVQSAARDRQRTKKMSKGM
ncbi:hypothetical protein TWF696_004801 [Orbilia brochopaga]|uniref:CUE domain-containing protein n=1 Tax=Orbilia brochopaga TaxID=3140254 RepID=A0AAV9V2T1_9PEZI